MGFARRRKRQNRRALCLPDNAMPTPHDFAMPEPDSSLDPAPPQAPPADRQPNPAAANVSSNGLRWWVAGWRAATGRAIGPLPTSVGPGILAATLLLVSLVSVLVERMAYGDFSLAFSPLGWFWGWIHLLPPLALVWWTFALTTRGVAHAQPVVAWVLLSQWALVFPVLLLGLWTALGAHGGLSDTWQATSAAWIIYGLFLAWVLIVLWRITQALHRWRWVQLALAMAVTALLPLQSHWLNTSTWTVVGTDEAQEPVLTLSQEVFLQQEALLQASLDPLPSSDGAQEIRVFGLVYAPYAQGVFLRESAMIADRMESRLGASGRVVRLLNHASTTDTVPWATPLNLQRTIQALGQRMDRERDILVLYLTAHGGEDHRLASSHWPLQVEDLTATQVRQWLDEAGIRFRAVVVSACYSGGWIDPLRGDSTLVMTAADKDRTSYGCGSDSDLTFFGKAVFHEKLLTTDSLEDAFAAAVPLIQAREVEAGKDDGFSNPQIAVGEAFRAQWAQRGRPPGTP